MREIYGDPTAPGIRCATTNQPSAPNSIPKLPSVTSHLDAFVRHFHVRCPNMGGERSTHPVLEPVISPEKFG